MTIYAKAEPAPLNEAGIEAQRAGLNRERSGACEQPVPSGTLPPDHCDARLDLGYVVSVLVQQAS